MMKLETFIKRLENGKMNNYVYEKDIYQGIIQTWIYEGKYILTWEEAEDGKQYDENLYTKDERYEFNNVEELLEYLKKESISPESFTP